MAYRSPLEHSFRRFSSVSLVILLQNAHIFAPSTHLFTITRLIAHLTDQPQNLKPSDVPVEVKAGPSTGSTSTSSFNVRTIDIINSEDQIARIFLPPPVQSTNKDIKNYLEYLSSLSAFKIKSSFSFVDIPLLKHKYQIHDTVKIRAPGPEERTYYYHNGEVCFYEIAFEHGLRFPMEDHICELLVTMDLAPAQLSPNMWAF